MRVYYSLLGAENVPRDLVQQQHQGESVVGCALDVGGGGAGGEDVGEERGGEVRGEGDFFGEGGGVGEGKAGGEERGEGREEGGAEGGVEGCGGGFVGVAEPAFRGGFGGEEGGGGLVCEPGVEDRGVEGWVEVVAVQRGEGRGGGGGHGAVRGADCRDESR